MCEIHGGLQGVRPPPLPRASIKNSHCLTESRKKSRTLALMVTKMDTIFKMIIYILFSLLVFMVVYFSSG